MAKFAHFADVHLGGWKQQPLQDLNFKSFQKAIEICILEKVDFLLIAGDLFDIAYPSIEILKETFAEFKKLKEAGIPCFLISGSHDYSVSGRTFLDVLEKAGFCKNVSNFEETGDKIILKPTIFNGFVIYGYPGKKSGLDVNDLKKIELRDTFGYKILMLHTTIEPAKGDLPIDAIIPEELPYADYYALGHLHIRFRYKNFVYPGPLFPNNFAELEELNCGTFCIFDTNSQELRRIEIEIKKVEPFTIRIDNAIMGTEQIILELERKNLEDKIVLLRLKGQLGDSKTSDIKFSQIEDFVKRKNAYIMLRNTHDLKSKDVELNNEIENSVDIEKDIIKNYLEQNNSIFNKNIENLINSLSIEKQEGETSETFSKRLIAESKKILNF